MSSSSPGYGGNGLILVVWLSLLLFISPLLLVEASTCLMLYMVADNDRDYYLRKDYSELVNSSAITDTNSLIRTWIYYDAWNQGVGQPLPNTVDTNGDPLTLLFTGSRIITYDSALQQMRVDVEYATEQNSDLSTTLQAFLEHALTDCLVDGYDSLFVGLAGYGGGDVGGGFGGDENHPPGRLRRQRQRRHLLLTNHDIARGIENALSRVDGSPDRVDVIGFDACLMSDIGVGADYLSVAKHILASESVVPGHGWPYANLSAKGDALSFASHILQTYLSSTTTRTTTTNTTPISTTEEKNSGSVDHQSYYHHESPKTMSLIDTDKYATFLEIWESFCEALLYWLQEEDASLHAFVSRARQSAVSFNGAADALLGAGAGGAGAESTGTGAFYPSSLDIGSFLRQFITLCNPTGSNLIVYVDITKDVYNEMFVTRGYGPGTTPGTGMHVTWPNQGEYAAHKDFWDQVLFGDDDDDDDDNDMTKNTSVTRHTPHFRELLKWFLTSSPPGGDHDDSICNERAVAKNENRIDRLVMMNQGGKDDTTGVLDILRAEVSSNVSQVEVQYGLDMSTVFANKLLEQGFARQDNEYWHLLGGDVVGKYFKTTFSATWDQNFYFFNVSGDLDPVYVFDRKDGAKQMHVLYFPADRRNDLWLLSLQDYLNFDMKTWEETLDAKFGFLTFSVDPLGQVNNNISLFTSQKNGGVFAEQPLDGGGWIIPLTYVDAYWQGRKITMLPGGLNQKVHAWSPTLEYRIERLPLEQVVGLIPEMDMVVVNLYASSYGSKNVESEVHYLDALAPDTVGREVLIEKITPSNDTFIDVDDSSSSEEIMPTSEPVPFSGFLGNININLGGSHGRYSESEEEENDDNDDNEEDTEDSATSSPTSSPTDVAIEDKEATTVFVADILPISSQSSCSSTARTGLVGSLLLLLLWHCWPT